MKISFIVPVYNVERYLDKCISSIISQSYTNIEVILVDDGSLDSSGQICDNWARADSRVRVIHKCNGGLSDARNTGLHYAIGDYVVFVDSDDFWIQGDGLSDLVDLLGGASNCNFIGFNCSYYYADENKYQRWSLYDSKLQNPITGEQAMEILIKSPLIPMSACLKIVSRDFLIDNNINFIKGIYCEDIPWFIDLLTCADRCIFVNKYIYAYRQNVSGSITSNFNEKNFNDLFGIIVREIELLEQRKLSTKAQTAILSFMAYEWCILLASIKNLPVEKQKSSRTELKRYKWLLNNSTNPKVHLVNIVHKFLGLCLTELLLRLYLNYHSLIHKKNANKKNCD